MRQVGTYIITIIIIWHNQTSGTFVLLRSPSTHHKGIQSHDIIWQ